MIQLNVNVQDPNGQPISGAIITLFTFDAGGRPCPVEPAVRNWGNFYNAEQPYAPQGFQAPFQVYGSATAQGYGTSYIPMTVWSGKASLDIAVILQPFRGPFIPAPRVWAGNMCGIRIDGLPPVDGGARDPSLFLSWFYDRYAEDVRKGLILPEMKRKGYLDVLLSWPDSRAVGATPEDFKATCLELVYAGFRPAVMLCSKDYDPHDVAGILQNAMPALELLVGLVPRFCVGWELSLWLSPTQVQQLIDAFSHVWLQQEGTLGYVHFQQGYFAFEQPGGVTADFWRANVGKLHGVLHQRVLDWDPGMYQARIVDCLERFAGGFGFPADSGFGHPFDFVALEITAIPQFDGQMSEGTGDSWGRTAISTPASHGPLGNVSVMGSGNGF